MTRADCHEQAKWSLWYARHLHATGRTDKARWWLGSCRRWLALCKGAT